MQKVDLDIVIDEKDFAAARRDNPGSYQQGVEVVAGGRTHAARAVHPKGGGFVKCDDKACGVYMEDLRNTDEELIQKFTDNVAKVFSYDQAVGAARGILGLEKLENTSQLLDLVVPE